MQEQIDKIPKGFFCYDCEEHRVCPHWSLEAWGNGYCVYLAKDDKTIGEERGRETLLYDRVKECGVQADSFCPTCPTKEYGCPSWRV